MIEAIELQYRITELSIIFKLLDQQQQYVWRARQRRRMRFVHSTIFLCLNFLLWRIYSVALFPQFTTYTQLTWSNLSVLLNPLPLGNFYCFLFYMFWIIFCTQCNYSHSSYTTILSCFCNAFRLVLPKWIEVMKIHRTLSSCINKCSKRTKSLSPALPEKISIFFSNANKNFKKINCYFWHRKKYSNFFVIFYSQSFDIIIRK